MTHPPTLAAPDASTRLGNEGQDGFVERYGALFEHSPWVARKAWQAGGFADAPSMIDTMAQVVLAASHADKLSLLRAHPELAGKEAEDGTLTEASSTEQADAGLDRLSADELSTIKRLNLAYRERHGFPFIICVRHYTKLGILAELQRRATRSVEAEFVEAIAQVVFIARLRLEQMSIKARSSRPAPPG